MLAAIRASEKSYVHSYREIRDIAIRKASEGCCIILQTRCFNALTLRLYVQHINLFGAMEG